MRRASSPLKASVGRDGAGMSPALCPGRRSRPSLAYRVILDEQVRIQLRDAPAQLQGYIDGIVAFLRTNPSTASVAFPVIAGESYHTIVFADGRGFLDYPYSRTARSSWS
jgi:hypothetical protein